MIEKAIKKKPTMGRTMATEYDNAMETIPYSPTMSPGPVPISVPGAPTMKFSNAAGKARRRILSVHGVMYSAKTLFSRKSTAVPAPSTPTNRYRR